MRTNWEQLPKGDVHGKWVTKYVSLTPKGDLNMTLRTWNEFGAHAAVHVLFDRVNSRIGLKPINPGARDAYKFSKQGSSGRRTIRIYRLFQTYGIVLPETVRFWDAQIDEDGIMVLDLRTAKVSKESVSHKKVMERSRELL